MRRNEKEKMAFELVEALFAFNPDYAKGYIEALIACSVPDDVLTDAHNHHVKTFKVQNSVG